MPDIEILTEEELDESRRFFGPMIPIPISCNKTLEQADGFLRDRGFTLRTRKVACDSNKFQYLITSKYYALDFTELVVGVTCRPPHSFRIFFKRDYCVRMLSGTTEVIKVSRNLGSLLANSFFALVDAKNGK